MLKSFREVRRWKRIVKLKEGGVSQAEWHFLCIVMMYCRGDNSIFLIFFSYCFLHGLLFSDLKFLWTL